MDDLTFEQAALLARWLSGDRTRIYSSTEFKHGRYIWGYAGPTRLIEVWVPATLEQVSTAPAPQSD